ncbi:hypothetical protein EN994_30470, partial [Mesorhizobium sp. M7A.F.Ca.CA.002.09.1.1]
MAFKFNDAASLRCDQHIFDFPWNIGRVFDPMAFRLFVPILAGATLRERLVACIGATIGIALTGVIASLV